MCNIIFNLISQTAKYTARLTPIGILAICNMYPSVNLFAILLVNHVVFTFVCGCKCPLADITFCVSDIYCVVDNIARWKVIWVMLV